jgi:mono/diheme cytochrome c family protein
MRNLRILASALLLVVSSTACTPLDDVMAAIFGRSMRDQRSYDPYEMTMAPPENSVPFAAGNLTAGPFQFNVGQPERGADMPDFGQVDLATPLVMEMVNPVPADAQSLARGEVMFNRSCAVCHGENGVGADAYIASKHPLLPIYNVSGPQVAGYTDGYIYGMIRVGRGLMPPYGHQISNFDRWHIVNYVRTLQRAAGNTPIIDQAGGN